MFQTLYKYYDAPPLPANNRMIPQMLNCIIYLLQMN